MALSQVRGVHYARLKVKKNIGRFWRFISVHIARRSKVCPCTGADIRASGIDKVANGLASRFSEAFGVSCGTTTIDIYRSVSRLAIGVEQPAVGVNVATDKYGVLLEGVGLGQVVICS